MAGGSSGRKKGKKEKTCSLCGKELQFFYNLQGYGLEGRICGSCYEKKLKEIYRINR